jgi:hypothetical protein
MLYRGMDRAQLDAAYDNSAAVPERDAVVADWSARSAKFRHAYAGHLDLAYGDTPLVRKKRLTPSQSSSRRICRLTAPWVTLSSSAARVKLPSRAAASKALIAFNGGRRERDTL